MTMRLQDLIDCHRRYPAMGRAFQKALDVLQPTHAVLEGGLALHRDALVADAFGFLPMVWTPRLAADLQALRDADLGGRRTHVRTTVLRQTAAAHDGAGAEELCAALEAAGVNVLMQSMAGGESRIADLQLMSGIHHLCRTLGRRLCIAGSKHEVVDICAMGKLAVIGSANLPPLQGDLMDLDDELELVEVWHGLGVRMMHLTYNRRGLAAEGCIEPHDGGLSLLGRDMVDRLNSMGIMIDLAHASQRSCLDAAGISNRPLVVSHAGCANIFEHPRNKSDEVLRAVADTGGIVGIYAMPAFLGPNATLQTMLNHIDHAICVAGEDHVAIGTDNAYLPPAPPDAPPVQVRGRFRSHWYGGWDRQRHLQHASDESRCGSLAWTNWPLFTVGMLARGHDERTIRKVVGLNMMRVIGDACGSTPTRGE